MCLSQVGQVTTIDAARSEAVLDVEGRPRSVSLAVLTLDGHPVEVGDWLLVHTGFAVAVLDADEAREVRTLHREITNPGGRP